MISYWQVLGRCCADPGFYQQIKTIVTTGYPPLSKDPANKWVTQESVVPKNMYKFLAKNLKLHISLFEIWEILRFFSPDPKGPDSKSLVEDSIRAIHELIKGSPLGASVYEILGVCCIDRDFTKAVADAAKGDKLGQFLGSEWNFAPAADDLRNLTKLAIHPSFPVLMGAMTMSVWDEPCDESISFNDEFNARHPWGSPRAWFAGEVMSRVRRHIND